MDNNIYYLFSVTSDIWVLDPLDCHTVSISFPLFFPLSLLEEKLTLFHFPSLLLMFLYILCFEFLRVLFVCSLNLFFKIAFGTCFIGVVSSHLTMLVLFFYSYIMFLPRCFPPSLPPFPLPCSGLFKELFFK